MLQNNPLLAQLKQQLYQQTPRVEGIIHAHEKGFGFLETDNKKSYFIASQHMKNVVNGDRVSGQIITKNDKESFEPETIIESSLQSFLGRITYNNKMMTIMPENLPHKFIKCKVNGHLNHQLKNGDWVKAKLLTHALENDKHMFIAEAMQFVAEDSAPDLLWLKTLARHNLETAAPLDELFTLNEAESKVRQDFTDIDFFTIDSKETLDMDDAISITTDDNHHFLLSIAIADPSTYFIAESATNQQAVQRSFSTYLPNYTISMLPKVLANDLCSLKPHEKRPAVVAQITINSQGEIIYSATRFTLAWVTSKAKLSYSEVSDFIEDNIPLTSPIASLPQQLALFEQLAKLRIQWRSEHALVFKDKNEYRFIFDEHLQLTNILKESRRIAHKIVEEMMVIANQAFTHKMASELGFGIFNIHNGFEAKYLDLVMKLLAEQQIDQLTKEQLATLEGYKTLRRTIDDNPLLEYRLRRFLSIVDFATTPSAHFSMGLSAYATWTSPIRKYGDLANHRLLKALILNQSTTPPEQQVLTVINERRKALRLAERDINQKLYSQYLSDKLDQSFTAEIIDINRGGARVRLTEIGAIAFLPLSLLHPIRDEISIQPEAGKITINQTTTYQLLDKLDVVINEVKADGAGIIVKLAELPSIS